MPKQEQFNPLDSKYKKVTDLPVENQEYYKDVEGGFARKEAKEDIGKLKYDVETENEEISKGTIKGEYKGYQIYLEVKYNKDNIEIFSGSINNQKLTNQDAQSLYFKLRNDMDEPYQDDRRIDLEKEKKELTEKGIEQQAKKDQYKKQITPMVKDILKE